MSNNQPVGTLRIYACGGTGINIASRIESNGDCGVYANVAQAYIDTSRTNLNSSIKEEDVFIVPRLDSQLHRSEGSGKNRGANEEAIADAVDAILSKFPPTELNVLVFSGSGGTGSVAGPLLADALLEDNQNVICVVVGTEESSRSSKNTYGTLMSLEAISEAHGVPLTVNYHHQGRTDIRSEIDMAVLGNLSAFAILINRKSLAIDLEDIHNLLNYNNVVDVEPGLTLINVYNDTKLLEEEHADKAVIGLGGMLRSTDTILPNVGALYDTIGYYTTKDESLVDIFYVVSKAGMDGILNRMLENEKRNERLLHSQRDSVSFKTNKGSNKSRTGRLVIN